MKIVNVFIGQYGLSFDYVREVAENDKGDDNIELKEINIEPEHCFLSESNTPQVVEALKEYVEYTTRNGSDAEHQGDFQTQDGEWVNVEMDSFNYEDIKLQVFLVCEGEE